MEQSPVSDKEKQGELILYRVSNEQCYEVITAFIKKRLPADDYIELLTLSLFYLQFVISRRY